MARTVLSLCRSRSIGAADDAGRATMTSPMSTGRRPRAARTRRAGHRRPDRGPVDMTLDEVAQLGGVWSTDLCTHDTEPAGSRRSKHDGNASARPDHPDHRRPARPEPSRCRQRDPAVARRETRLAFRRSSTKRRSPASVPTRGAVPAGDRAGIDVRSPLLRGIGEHVRHDAGRGWRQALSPVLDARAIHGGEGSRRPTARIRAGRGVGLPSRVSKRHQTDNGPVARLHRGRRHRQAASSAGVRQRSEPAPVQIGSAS
jgi:hypothetical protein